jgi:hypothetical protein
MLHVVWVVRVDAHPGRECLVVGKQPGIVATLSEPRGLCPGVDVEKTDGDRVELVGGGCGHYLAGGDGISGEQKVAAIRLKGQRPLHNRLGGLLPPGLRGHGRDADDVTELNTLDLLSELVGDELPHGRFAGAARAGQR